MGVEEDLEDLNALAESTDAAVDSQDLASAVDSVTLQPILPPAIPPPAVPQVAPVPAVPPVLRPLAPLPIRPPVFRPPAPKKEEAGSSSGSDSDDDEAGRGGAVPGSTAEYEITEESRLVRERHEKAMQDLMMKRRGAALAVPTNDKAVRARLRRLGEPMTLFGEREMERRDRLRMLMAKLDAEGELEKLMKAHEDEEAAASAAPEDVEEEMLQYPFYTEGSKALLDARIDIAKFSIARAALRLERARRRRDDPDEDVDVEIDWPGFDRTAGLLQAQEAKIRASYQLHLEVGTDTLKWIMTIDSLFLLDLLYSYKNKREKMDPDKSANVRSEEDSIEDNDRGGIVQMTRDSIVKDVMKVENQIPTFVLRKIMLQAKDSMNEVRENEEDESIDRELGEMLMTFCKAIAPLGLERCSPSEAVRQHKHLLDLLYNLILRRTVPEAAQTKKNELRGASFGYLIKMVSIPASKITEAWNESSKFSFMKKLKVPVELIFRIIPLVTQLIPGCSESLQNDPSQEIVMIPTVSNLQKAGIKLCLAAGGIRTITFDQKTATLKLPQIVLSATTEVLLRNLVAYEMISQSGSWVLTRYTELMCGIIDTSEDVKLLRGASIVSNHLNSDDKVVQLFNGMIQSVGSKSSASELDKTIQDVNKYYNNTRSVKAYNHMRKYVYSSWKFLTIAATVVLILLMGLQTFCSMWSCPRLFHTE